MRSALLLSAEIPACRFVKNDLLDPRKAGKCSSTKVSDLCH